MKIRAIGLIALLVIIGSFQSALFAQKLELTLRSRVETEVGSGKFRVLQEPAQWSGSQTAIIICDMWNEHWCKGATDRVAEMAPRMN